MPGGIYVIGKLGEGGMGVVYSAFDPELDRKVAIKLLRAAETGSEDSARGFGAATARLLREAQAMAQLSHPNVVSVYEVGKFADRVFVAMEFVDGVPLTEWLKSAKRSVAEVLKVFKDAGADLAAAHDAGIIHRDFKPANVIVGSDGRVRVLDFGLARRATLRSDSLSFCCIK